VTATRPDHLAGSDDRRGELRARAGNGLDTVEVLDPRHLALTFLRAAPHDVTVANVSVEGPSGVPVPVLGVRRLAEDDPEIESQLVVELLQPGRSGTHRLALVEPDPDGRPGHRPLRTLDPLCTAVDFRFDLEWPGPSAGPVVPATDGHDQHEVSYLARDFAGLRDTLLTRLAAINPTGAGGHTPEFGVMLIELFAYAGDDLSYYQDAVATEAYMRTARRRISVRRHARLLGYRLHEGCAARVWVFLEVAREVTLPPAALLFTTATGAGFTALIPGAEQTLRPARNQIELWHWGRRTCELPAGATAATLLDPAGPDLPGLNLRPGDVLLFEEIADATGGPPDPDHRHAVRLVAVRRTVDPLFGVAVVEVSWAGPDALPFAIPVRAADGIVCGVARGNIIAATHGVPVTTTLGATGRTLPEPGLAWSQPFPGTDAVAGHQASVLRGLFDQWRTIVEFWWSEAEQGRPLSGEQRAALLALFGPEAYDELGLSGSDPPAAPLDAQVLRRLLMEADRLLAGRCRRLTVLAELAEASGELSSTLIGELTQVWGPALTAALDPAGTAALGPAAAMTTQDPDHALPVLHLVSATRSWMPTTDLLATGAGPVALVEVDDDNRAQLRFPAGDEPGGEVTARFLIGGGAAGNLPAELINEVRVASWAAPADAAVACDALQAVLAVRNPLPAIGGVEPEDVSAAKRALPRRYLTDQPRALAAGDYALWAARVDGVARAAATMRWTGSAFAAQVAVQPVGGGAAEPSLLKRVHRRLGELRRVGHDLWIVGPVYRPAIVTLRIDLAPNAVRADLRPELLALLSAGHRADGSEALFHPRRLGFGEPLVTSKVIAAVQGTDGVESVVAIRAGFLDDPAGPRPTPPASLTVGALDIIRLDNDPANPGDGYAEIDLRGGR
jgi:hypothetical protein